MSRIRKIRNSALKILYVGTLARGGTCRSRFEALVDLGYEVVTLDTDPFLLRWPRLVRGFMHRFLVGPGIRALNTHLIGLALSHRPDIVWIDKGQLVWPSSLECIRNSTQAMLIHYNTDDIMNPQHHLDNYLQALHLYDLHFTSNTFNVVELRERGVPRVIGTELAYDHRLYRPMELTDEDVADLGSEMVFVGHWEQATEQLVYELVRHDLPVRVWGYGWHKARYKRRLRGAVEFQWLSAEKVAKVYNATKIGLGILSKWNRNQTAGRSFEIPACGAFLLAERTPTHQKLYEEGIEAEFFGGLEELLDKAEFYLQHDKAQERIARAGYERCVSSGYFWRDRVREMMTVVAELYGED